MRTRRGLRILSLPTMIGKSRSVVVAVTRTVLTGVQHSERAVDLRCVGAGW